MSADGGLWYVKMRDGDVAPMTLDQLDEAYNAGRIDDSVIVLPAGDTKWARLGALLGTDSPLPAVAPSTPAISSLRPVSLDLSELGDLDLGGSPFKKKSRKALYGVVAGALAFGLVAFAATHGSDGASPTTASAAAPPPVVAPAPPPVAAPAPPPPAAETPAPADARFSDQQKSKLAAADKAREDKAKAKKKARTGGGSHPSAKYKSQGFTSGGNKFDPLNAN